MVKDLLYISKKLLNYLNANHDLTDEEKEYIIYVVIKVMDLSTFVLEDIKPLK